MDDPAIERFYLSVAKMPSGLWIVESPQLKGLMATGRCFDQAMEAVPAAVDEIRKALVGAETPQAKAYERIFS